VSFELIRILYLYATLTIIFMNPAIELLFALLQACPAGRRRTFVLLFFMQRFTSNHFNYALAAGLSIIPSWR